MSDRIIIFGDSIGEGGGVPAGQTIPDLLQVAFPWLKVINAAIGGATFGTQSNTSVSPYRDMYGAIRARDIVVLFPGSIDVSLNTSLATVESNHTSIVGYLLAQQAIVLQMTMIPKQVNLGGSQSQMNTDWTNYNTWINAKTSGAQFVCDPTVNAAFNSNANSWKSTTNYASITNNITGVNAVSPTSIPLPSFAAQGAVVASVHNNTDSTDVTADFEATLSAPQAIVQNSANLAGKSLTVTTCDGSHPNATGNGIIVNTYLIPSLQAILGV